MTSDNAYEHFDFPAVGGSICRKSKRGRGRYADGSDLSLSTVSVITGSFLFVGNAFVT
jgi:hypothetical protein